MEVAVSVTALLTIAVQSATTIYDVVTSIRNGPDQLEEIATAVSALRRMLNEIETIKNSDAGESNKLFETQNLKSTMIVCNAALELVQQKLRKIKFVETDGNLTRTWKRATLAIRKDDLKQIWNTIHHQIISLNLQLNILHTTLTVNHTPHVVGIKELLDSGFGALAEKLQGQASEQLSLASRYDDQYRRISDQQLAQNPLILELHRQEIMNGLENVVSRLETRIETASQNALLDAQRETDQLSKKIEYNASASASQFSNVLRKLSELELCVSGLTGNDPSKLTSTTGAPSNSGLDFTDCITRLYGFVSKEEGLLSSSDTESIVDDIDLILGIIENDGITRKRRRKLNDGSNIDMSEKNQPLTTQRNIKTMRGIANLASGVEIVNKGRASVIPYSPAEKAKYGLKHSQDCSIWNTDHGIITMCTETFEPHANTKSTATNSSFKHSFSGQITFIPRSNLPQAAMTASFSQRIFAQESSHLMFRLSFRRMIPSNSYLFKCVQNGDINGIIRLVQDGLASLRDCDIQGRGLLTYASHYLQPSVCKFLIDNGADVQSLEASFGELTCTVTPMQQSHFRWDVALTEAEAHANLECNKILLQAGSSFDFEKEGEGGWIDSMQFGETVPLALYLDHSYEPLDLEARKYSGRTSLLELLYLHKSFGVIEIFDKIHMLLGRGAKTSAVDDAGNNCLHLFLMSLHDRDSSQQQQQTLVELIRAGANVYSSNNEGLTPSDVVRFSEYKEIWRGALEDCGYDADTVVQPPRSRSRASKQRVCHIEVADQTQREANSQRNHASDI